MEVKLDEQDFLNNFERLLPESGFIKKIVEDFDPIDYFSSKEQMLSLIDDGYRLLPSIYRKPFLDPLRELAQNYYEELIGFSTRYKDENGDTIPGPFKDWFDVIYQHKTEFMKKYSRAFEEYCADIYDGFLSKQERVGVKPPDYQKVSPLIRWGGRGPYTYPAPGSFSSTSMFAIQMAVVCMPISYSKNIIYWIANGHEVAGHDILHADEGLLNELEDRILQEIDKESSMKQETITYNKREIPLAEFAKWYWRYTMDETASDVLGTLNLGPAFGIGLALLFSSPSNFVLDKPKLRSRLPIYDVHPIHSLRVLLAAEVVRNIPELDRITAYYWADLLEKVAYRYIENTEEFELYDRSTEKSIVKIPHSSMKRTLPIVAKTIALSPLKQIEYHSFNEINTWANDDERLVKMIANDFLQDRDISITEDTYPAHIVSGAVMALISSSKADIIKVSEKSITGPEQNVR